MPFANNDGVRIYYEVEGKGPPLVLCHGFSENLNEWRIFGYVDTLKDNYQVILIDGRGHGKSDKPYDPEAQKMKYRVTDVVSVLDHLNIGKAHFMGYSLGGNLGWGIAKFAPDRFNSIIIGGSQPYEVPLDEPDSFREFAIPLLKRGMKAVYDFISENRPEYQTTEWREIIMANDPEALLAYLYMREFVDYKDVLPTIIQPMLLYMGEADSDYSQAKRCVDYIPNVTFVSFSGFDHEDAFFRSDEVLPHITRFLEKVTQK